MERVTVSLTSPDLLYLGRGDSLPRRDEKYNPLDKKKMDMLGRSGVIREENGLPIYDPNQSQMSPYRARGLGVDHGELHRILFYDPVVQGVFTLMMIEVMRAYWYVTYNRDETDEEKEQRELLEWTFGLSGKTAIMSGGLRRLVFHLLWAKMYGFSILELSWDFVEVDGKERFLPTAAKWRAPWSVYRWIYEGDELIGFTQLVQGDVYAGKYPVSVTASGQSEIFIPIDKCLLFSNKAVDGNPEGISEFRTAFPYVKAKLEQFARDEMAEDRLANGLIEIRETGDERGPFRQLSLKDKTDVKTCLNAIANGTSNRIIIPFGIDIVYKWPTYDRPKSTEKLKLIDRQIMLSATSSILDLDSSGGGKGQSESLSQLTFHSMEHGADDIVNVINGNLNMIGDGLVKKILGYNFGEQRKGRSVQVHHFGISHQDSTKMVDAMSKASMMMLMSPDAVDEYQFRMASRLGHSDLESIKKERKKAEEKNASKNGHRTDLGDQKGPRMPKPSLRNIEGDPIEGGDGAKDEK